jgi:hypothetical protein
VLHPSHGALHAYDAGATAQTDLIGIENHLLWCAECRRVLTDSNAMARLFGRWTQENDAVLTAKGRQQASECAVLEMP